jgi:hypothetical protein
MMIKWLRCGDTDYMMDRVIFSSQSDGKVFRNLEGLYDFKSSITDND